MTLKDDIDAVMTRVQSKYRERWSEPKKLVEQNYDAMKHFDWEFETKQQKVLIKMLAAAYTYGSLFLTKQEPRWLTFCGPAGIGKTHLAKKLLALWRESCGYTREKGDRGAYTKSHPSRFMDWGKAVAEERNEEKWGYIASHADFDFLVIDDPGKEHSPSDWAKKELFNLLNARLGQWTITTWNLQPWEIEKTYGKPIKDRLYRGGSMVMEVPPTTKSYNE